LLEQAAALAPKGELVEVSDVGNLAAFLVSDAAKRITGTVIPVGNGQHLHA
jgi:enoyl-[acyl-carrier protein] reductase I